jgi:hypothetical protein
MRCYYEHDFAAADLERQVVSEDGAQVRVGVHTIAVRL